MARDFADPHGNLYAQDNFHKQEVGLTHPNRPSYVRLHDNGDVEITACEGLSVWLHAASRSITFIADSVKFITRDDGFKWNKLNLNKDAWQFNQPTFHPSSDDTVNQGLYRGVDMFMQDDS